MPGGIAGDDDRRDGQHDATRARHTPAASRASARGAEKPTSAAPASAEASSSLVPSLALPKAGGALQGLGEKFAANPLTGVPSLTVPIVTSSGRAGFGPQLALSYQPGSGNGPFGLEWALGVPAITRKTEKGLPRYDDADDSDTFILSSAEDLVPALVWSQADNRWLPEPAAPVGRFTVRRYRPRVEGLFARIERLRDPKTGEVFWRSITKDNVTSVYGQSAECRVADPEHSTRVFKWLLEATYDDKGNIVLYTYKPEDLDNVDPAAASEAHRRNGTARVANQYVKHIYYGNTVAYKPDPSLAAAPSRFEAKGGWLFHVVFDYGDQDPRPPSFADGPTWPCRQDPFSTYRAGFEMRTYRLCRRVLMFHSFPNEADVGADCLVHSTDFTYMEDPVVTKLVSVTSVGYLKDGSGVYQPQALPSLDLTYTEATLDPNLHTLDAASVENLPIGLDGARYEWIDLDGEGLSGVLTEQGGAWLYKRNLGQGELAPVAVVATQPSLANLAGGRQQILDLASNGHKSLVDFNRPLSGYYARTQEVGARKDVAPDGQWDTFVPFASCPTLDWQDPNLKMIDLDGDGRADILITEDELLVWYPSRAEEGFGPAEWMRKPFDDTKGPALVFADGTQSIYLADMSGGGLTDLVRIRNGEVSYWPNLGYGRFGARVVMDAPPVFDYVDQFEQRRVRLADIDGSGTTDIVYLGRDTIRYWLNQSGNRWSAPRTIAQFPATDNLSSVMVLDLLGTGTSCIVWSSPLPRDARAPMQYIDLMSGVDWDRNVMHGCKPYLLGAYTNNLGATTRMRYAPSTQFYVADRKAGHPWITRIPFPVQVVTQVESHDEVSGATFTSSYAYHHGYYDADEREFRGFGMVEQWDALSFADTTSRGAGLFDSAAVDADLHLPPVHTKTWYHTGFYRDHATLATRLADGYYQGDGLAARLPDSAPERTDLSPREERECYRALKGMTLRQEVYADDGPPADGDPYAASEHRYAIRLLQPAQDNRYAVAYAYELEALDYHYERNPADPRVGHKVTLAVDDYGHVTKSAAIGYGRRKSTDPERQLLISYSEADVINTPDGPGFYRLGVPAETRAYEITGLRPKDEVNPPANIARFTVEYLTDPKLGIPAASEIPYETAPISGIQKRLLKKARTLYYTDDLLTALPLGQSGMRALPYAQRQLAFTAAWLQAYSTLLHQANSQGTDPAALGAILADPQQGGYLQDGDGTWWTQSGRQVFDSNRFYLPIRAIDPFGQTTSIEYDDYALLVKTVTDPFKNVVAATNDYRLLHPAKITDPNGNTTGAASDALGMVVATWETGKPGQGSTAEGSTPSDPSKKFEYHLDNWATTTKQPNPHPQPGYIRTLERETYGPNTRWLETYTYSDGFGRVVQAKAQAEPDRATPNARRWIGSGRTIYDNKGNPVKQYEPFFSADFNFETEAQLVMSGVTPVMRYDSLGRLIRTDLPDGSYTRVAFDPWQQTTWDQNDTLRVTDPATGAVSHSRWYQDRSALPSSDPRNQALQASLPHADTPTVVHLDTLGRTFLTIQSNGADGTYETRVKLDIEGNQLAVTDARTITVLTSDHDQLGRAMHANSSDADETWTLFDVAGKPIWMWTSRGYAVQTTYDELRRPLGLYVSQSGSPERIVEYKFYGETAPAAAKPRDNNLLGRVYQHLDGAGVVTIGGYDFKGNPLTSERRFMADPTKPVDWSTNPAPLPETFTASTTYDALNRPTSSTAPDGSMIWPSYNQTRLLQTVQVQLPSQGKIAYVTGIAYDAKGQRTSITYGNAANGNGNGAITQYAYDPQTYRLVQLTTWQRSLAGVPGQPNTSSTIVQDLGYVYDPIGNIVSITDNARETVYVNNSAVKPNATYSYDAIYRLKTAMGREHNSKDASPEYDWTDAPRRNLTNPNDLQAMQAYTETYTYDAVGNITMMQHQAGSGGWTRSYNYATTSNRLLSTSVTGDAPAATYTDTPQYSAKYAYEQVGARQSGNMASMPHLAGMLWDFKSQLQQVNLGGGGTAYYVYDSSGQRVRKAWAHDGIVDERIYLGGYERYRRTSAGQQIERIALHVMDDTRRICLVETTTADTSQPALKMPSVAIRYQLVNHLGSAAMELNENAAIISYEEYYPYGNTSYQAGRSVAETSLKRYRYTGKERDEETGLSYHGARYYAPWLGRWTTPDPSGTVDGINLYEAMRNSPARWVDSNGRFVNPDLIAGTRDIEAQFKRNLAALGGSYGVSPEIAEKAWQTLPLAAQLRYLGTRVFSPGEKDDAGNRFVYTRLGWIDVGHFFTSAAIARGLTEEFGSKGVQGHTAALATLGITYGLEVHQFATKMLGDTRGWKEFHQWLKAQPWLPKSTPDWIKEGGWGWDPNRLKEMGWATSAFTYEDLVSNYLGAMFGAGLKQGQDPFQAFVRLLSNLDAVDPNKVLPGGEKAVDILRRDLLVPNWFAEHRSRNPKEWAMDPAYSFVPRPALVPSHEKLFPVRQGQGGVLKEPNHTAR